MILPNSRLIINIEIINSGGVFANKHIDVGIKTLDEDTQIIYY